MATGTVTQTWENAKPGQIILKVDWLASAGSGTLGTVAINSSLMKSLRGKYCLFAITKTGATKVPTASYDVTLSDAFSCNVFGGALDNRSSVNVQQVQPSGGGGLFPGRLITSSLNFALSNNTAPSASGTVRFFFVG